MTFSAVVMQSIRPYTEKAGLRLSKGSNSYYGHSKSLKLVAVDFLFTKVMLNVPAIDKLITLDYSDPKFIDKLHTELSLCMSL